MLEEITNIGNKFVGQTVFRSEVHTSGKYPMFYGYTSHVITKITKVTRINKSYELHLSNNADFNPFQGVVYDKFAMKDYAKTSVVYDFGVTTLEEIKWLLDGALLDKNGPVYNEEQSQVLKDHHYILQQIADDPHKNFYLSKEFLELKNNRDTDEIAKLACKYFIGKDAEIDQSLSKAYNFIRNNTKLVHSDDITKLLRKHISYGRETKF